MNLNKAAIFDSTPAEYYDYRDRKGGYESTTRIDQINSQISAKENLSLIAGQKINLTGGKYEAGGMMELLAEHGISIINDKEFEQYDTKYTYRKSRWYGSKKVTVEEHRQTNKVVQTLLKAGKDIKLRTVHGDLIIKSSKFDTNGHTHVDAMNGQVQLLADMFSERYSKDVTTKSLFYIKMKGSGHTKATAVYNEFGGMGLVFPDGQSFVMDYGCVDESDRGIEIDGRRDVTRDEQEMLDCSQNDLIKRFADNPEYAWMNKILAQENLSLNQLDEFYDKWHYSKQQLTPAFAAIIAIAVTIATSGVGAGAAVALGAAEGGAIASMTGALVTSASVTAAQAIANGDNPVEALVSDKFLKQAVTAVATAGTFSTFSEYLDLGIAGESNFKGIDSLDDFSDISKWGQQFKITAAQAVLKSTISSTINQTSWSDAFVQNIKSASIAVLGQAAARDIGNAANAGDIDSATQYALHAITGCALGSLSNSAQDSDTTQRCIAGGTGAVIGEFFTELYGQSSTDTVYRKRANGEIKTNEDAKNYAKKLYDLDVDYAKLTAAVFAFAAGLDVDIAATTAENAGENNWAYHALMAIALGYDMYQLHAYLTTDEEFRKAYQALLDGNPEPLGLLCLDAGLNHLGEILLDKLTGGAFKLAKKSLCFLEKERLPLPKR